MARNQKGQFSKRKPVSRRKKLLNNDHCYCGNNVTTTRVGLNLDESWKVGRRLVEWEVLLGNLKYCQKCKLGPVPLTINTIQGELQKGLGGYLYVKCENPDCEYINRAAYGKTYHQTAERRGMPCFAVNTKLGTAMIDSLGGPRRVNNMLATLNLKTVSDANLKKMEIRAGDVVEKVSTESSRAVAEEAFKNEMETIAHAESQDAQVGMSGLIEDLGVCPLPDSSPVSQLRLHDDELDWTDTESDDENTCSYIEHVEQNVPETASLPDNSCSTPLDNRIPVPPPVHTPKLHRTLPKQARKAKVRLLPKYPCRTRSGMSVAVDTAWHKRGFDSLTSHTFFMTTGKSTKQKKVIKTVVGHRICGVCSWWRRKRPGQKVRPHRCVRNHTGSARAMEATSGVKGVHELLEEGTPVEYLEGDGDNTLISKIKTNLGISMKKRFDKNHVVKNFTKSLYCLKNDKGIKLSKSVITHLESV
ncbi:uncharacterized protein LOC123542269 isoform X2 [Mercenaria mercenaria]|uniref:uncharacterized protein LOC123542269 isoform X2 n=1 Tax=Mercenaria mercenaria TaxID=6596 RepID=UPI00234E9ADE|nr:uncharacterized protein LOC123542269 isoform X2 [Mercenaria mercenaria]